MSILKINSLSMAFGGQEVFQGISEQINKGDHIGLVGPNGAGKTTLLRLITRDLEPVNGHIGAPSELSIGYLPQRQEFLPEQTVYQEVFAGLGELASVKDELHRLEEKIRDAEESSNNSSSPDTRTEGGEDKTSLARLFAAYADLTDRYELLGGSTAEARISATLDGLGIPRRLWHSRMETLSGGERNMVGLARILISDHDLMLLDEPGNHLDFSGLEWLESYLSSSPKAYIIVSHNRYMLDRVCGRIWELDRGKMEDYTGNYSDYRHEKLTRQLAQESAFKRAQKDIARLNFNIQRLKSWASVYDNPKLAKTAKQFERRVEKLEKVEKPTGDGRKLLFRFLEKPPQGKIALEAKHYRKQFDGSPPLLDNINFLITQGERVAFIGDNGTGKSSLIKDVIEHGSWENPNLRTGKSVSVAYFSQLGENLELKVSVVEETMRLTRLLKGDAANLLHRFLFTRDDLDKRVEVLSGGETARLQLAVLMHSGAGMLLLDEPTNHLDINSREAVEDALEEYPGTLIIVSHDRYFLNKLADRILHFTPPDIHPYDGNFSDFWKKHRHKYQAARKTGHGHLAFRRSRDSDAFSDGDSGKKKKTGRKRRKFDSNRFREIENEIHRLENVRPEVEAEMAKLQAKGKTTRARSRHRRLEEIDVKMKELYREWVVLGEKKKKW